jgi:polynucleotide 5'-hydroxyl-kinase GRC3/NOL9
MWFRPIWSSVGWRAFLADDLLHIPPEWAAAAEHVCRRDVHRIIVLGARDTGKSRFCRFLTETSMQSGRSTALLDTDVGQKTIGPPACVTMSDTQGLSLAFVGTTNPVLGWQRLIEGTRRLEQRTDADCLIVNTSGLLSGPGLRLKAAKIDALQPDLLIALGDDPALADIVNGRASLPVLHLPSSPQARRKTDGERRAARREAFRSYFAGAEIIQFDRRMVQEAYADAPLPADLLVGLINPDGTDIGMGVVKGAAEEMIEVLSPVATGTIARVVPGLLCLDENFAERPVKAQPLHT